MSIFAVAGSHSAQGPDLTVQMGHAWHVGSVSFNKDGSVLASGSRNEAKLWDMKTRQELRTITSPSLRGNLSVAMDPDGALITIGTDYKTMKWNIRSGQEIPLSNSLEAVSFSGNGKVLVKLSGTHLIVHEYPAGPLHLSLEGIDAFGTPALSHDARLLAFVENNLVRIWSVAEKRELWSIPGGSERITSVAFHPNGSSLAVGGMDGVSVHQLGTKEIRKLPGYDGLVYSLAYSPDGQALAAGVSDMKSEEHLRLWTLSGTKPSIESLGVSIRSLTCAGISSDGNFVAAGANNGTIGLLDVGLRLHKVLAYGFRPSTLRFSPDSRFLAAASAQGSNIEVWNTATCMSERKQTVPAWASSLSALGQDWSSATFHGRTFNLTANGSKAAILWETIGRKDVQLATILFIGGTDWLVHTPDGYYDGTTGSRRLMQWQRNGQILEAAASEHYFRTFAYPNLLRSLFNGKFQRRSRQ